MNVTVIGAGAWGTALAKLLHEGNSSVTLWDIDTANLDALRRGRNEPYLPGVELPREWHIEPDWDRAVADRDVLVLAVPSVAFRQVSARLPPQRALLVSVTKGIEYETGLTMSRVLRQTAPHHPAAVLSGPTFALEVARGIPTAIVCASDDPATSEQIQLLFHRPAFRVYWSTDTLGVELGGALKNVIAIAAGVGDGLGFGDNTKAALVTRGMAEIRRLGVACGARPETFSGLSGIGDLTVTCFSRLSRNRAFGERLGRGESIESILGSAPKLAEGYPTARAARCLARQLGVTAPVVDEVYAMLYEGKDPRQAVVDLTHRESKAED